MSLSSQRVFSGLQEPIGSWKASQSEKIKRWEAAGRTIEKVTDGIGKTIDAGIKETVIALKVNGFATIASCEGHLDHGLPFPWVDIASPVTEQNLSNPRYQELAKKYARERIGEDEKNELIKLIEAQIAANLIEHQRLKKLLDAFYETEKKHPSALTLIKGIWNYSRLQTCRFPDMNMIEIKQYLSRFTPEENAQNLYTFRDELQRFTEFLKNKYFNAEASTLNPPLRAADSGTWIDGLHSPNTRRASFALGRSNDHEAV